jgi:hypothetical protein
MKRRQKLLLQERMKTFATTKHRLNANQVKRFISGAPSLKNRNNTPAISKIEKVLPYHSLDHVHVSMVLYNSKPFCEDVPLKG